MSIFLHSSAPVIKPPSSSSQDAAQVPKPQSFPLKIAFPKKISAAHIAVDPTKDTVFRIPCWRSGKDDLYTRRLKLNTAFQYFEDMVGKGHKPDLFDATQLLYDLTKSNRPRKAVRVMALIVESGGIERMMQNGFVSDTHALSRLLKAYYRERGVDETRRIVDGVIANGGTLKLGCYHDILAGLCKEDRVDEAIQLFRDLPATGFRPNGSTYNVLLSGLWYEGRWQEACELLDEMVGNDCLPNIDTCNHLISALTFHGKTDQALAVLDDLVLTSKQFKFKLNASSYNPIIERLCKERKVNDVVKRLDEMICLGCIPNDETYSVIAVLCEEGCVQEAFSVIQSLRNKQRSLSIHDLYDNVIASLCRNGKTYEAFRFLFEMTLRGFTPDSFTYSSLIKGLCSEKMHRAAVDMFTVMEEDNVYKPDVDNFNALVYGLWKCGRTDMSFDVFETMIRKGCMPNQRTYTILIEGIIREDKDLGVVVLKELSLRGVLSGENMERLAMQYDLLI